MTGWQPLSTRATKRSPEEYLHEGVPAHLAQPLLHWLQSLFEETYEMNKDKDAEHKAHRIAARLRLDLQRIHLGPRGEISKPRKGIYRGENPTSQTLIALAKQDVVRRSGFSGLFSRRPSANAAVCLDIIDAALADGVKKDRAFELERLLTDGGSAWRVAEDTKALQRRVDPTATEALRVTTDASTAATHLNAAWTAAYGRHPIPSRAYSEAIKAVEVASIPAVLPHDRIATLGKVIGQLRQQQEQWHLAIAIPGGNPADISTLLAMLRLLWEGQTDRHGNPNKSIPVSSEAAVAAVHLAITLVQWFRSGAIRRVNGTDT